MAAEEAALRRLAERQRRRRRRRPSGGGPRWRRSVSARDAEALAPGALGDLVVRRDGKVRHVVVGGRQVVEDGVLATADNESIAARARAELSCHPPIKYFTAAGAPAPKAFPLPNGSSQMGLMLRRCRTSSGARPRSSLLSKGS